MNTLDKVLATLCVFIVATMYVLFSIGCVRTIDNQDDYEEQSINFGPAMAEELDTEKNNQDPFWQSYQDENFTFEYPENWIVSVTAGSDELSKPNYYLRVRSTTKQIIAGGVAPDDYYLAENGVNIVNEEFYANDYIVFQVDVFVGLAERDWLEFFQTVYPEIITLYDYFQVPYQPEIEGVEPLEVAGLTSGQSRFFAKHNGLFYEFSLISRNVDGAEARELFKGFIAKFSF